MKIDLQGVSKQFGNQTALDGIDCEFDSGQLIALVGSNGAGKTTLLRTLATLYKPTTGQILFDQEPLSHQRLDLRSKLHYLDESPRLHGTAIDHICMSANLYDRSLTGLKARILGWLKDFGIFESAEATNLSRGQKYKAAFIGLLAASPQLWLLDEPFAAGADPTGISAIKREINKAVGAGHTVIYSTQIVELAEQFSDRVLVLHKGKLLVDIPSVEIQSARQDQTLARMFENLKAAK